MSAAATTGSSSARGLVFIISLVCLVCVVNADQAKERLAEMREQLTKVEELIEHWKVKVETERIINLEMMDGNDARMKCIRQHSLAPVQQMESMEDALGYNRVYATKSFSNMAAKLQELESRLEDMKAQLRFAEHFGFDSENMMF